MFRRHLGLYFDFALLQHQVIANSSLPHVVDVVNHRLEVRRCVVRARNEDVVRFT